MISQGKLKITNPITDYLPDLPDPYKAITISQLISHTSGIRSYNKGEWMKISSMGCTTAKEALGVFINDPLSFEPGTKSQYTSFGYVLLSALVEEISGESFYDFVQHQLLEPLAIRGMGADQSAPANANQVSYYSKWDPDKTKAKLAPAVNNTCKFGGGGMVGTATALVKLHLAMLNGEIVQGELRELYYQSFTTHDGQPTAYAFGIGVGEKDGMNYHSHSGSAIGANCILIIYPSEKLVVVVLGNLENNTMNSFGGKIGNIFREK